uniref:Uncharacterized protein n=1 Tax=Romanomermis culicivorax TaxID=13658 RepID=A0A915KGS7_ROMCU
MIFRVVKVVNQMLRIVFVTVIVVIIVAFVDFVRIVRRRTDGHGALIRVRIKVNRSALQDQQDVAVKSEEKQPQTRVKDKFPKTNSFVHDARLQQQRELIDDAVQWDINLAFFSYLLNVWGDHGSSASAKKPKQKD